MNNRLDQTRKKLEEAEQKLMIMEEVAGDVCTNGDNKIVVKNSDGLAEYQSKFLDMEEKLLKIRSEKAKLETQIAEYDKKLKWTNDSYQEIIENKDKTISSLTSITEESNIVNKYKMLLLHYKSELELRNIYEIKEKVESELKVKQNMSEQIEKDGGDNDAADPKISEGNTNPGLHEYVHNLDEGATGVGVNATKSKVGADKKLMEYIRRGDAGKESRNESISSRNRGRLCWAFDKCRREGCMFLHTVPNDDILRSKKACWFGAKCNRKFCPFVHPKKGSNGEDLIHEQGSINGKIESVRGESVGGGERKRTEGIGQPRNLEEGLSNGKTNIVGGVKGGFGARKRTDDGMIHQRRQSVHDEDRSQGKYSNNLRGSYPSNMKCDETAEFIREDRPNMALEVGFDNRNDNGSQFDEEKPVDDRMSAASKYGSYSGDSHTGNAQPGWSTADISNGMNVSCQTTNSVAVNGGSSGHHSVESGNSWAAWNRMTAWGAPNVYYPSNNTPVMYVNNGPLLSTEEIYMQYNGLSTNNSKNDTRNANHQV